MTRCGRRSFLKRTGSGVVLAGAASAARAAGANARLVIGVIGCGGQGNAHVGALGSIDHAAIGYVCDPDEKRLAQAAKRADGVRAVADLRRILDDKSVDGVTIATPDHWHAPAALLAVEAGKHVYVEKPCSHNVRESRRLLDAARRGKRVVQHGTQARSCEGIIDAIRMLREGVIGEVRAAKAWNIQRRSNIGHAEPSSPPAGCDYDLWVGPAAWMPFQSNRHHYTWHWWYTFGCGGIGNDGIHELDYARWGLGVETHPTRVFALGGKYHFDDDQQFPDTQQVSYEYDGGGKVGDKRMLIYEQRLWSPAHPFNVDSGAEFFGTSGTMFLSKRGKIEIKGEGDRRIDKKPRGSLNPSVARHVRNWLDCIRSGERPLADIELAHRTATVVHLGNVATRVGRGLTFDAAAERVVGDSEADALLSRKYREGGHWAIPRGA